MQNKNNIQDIDKIKRTTFDSVFTHLFSQKKYLKQLYKDLENKTQDIQDEEIEILTMQNVLTNALYNDLGFMVKDEIIILAEAQTTYTKNIVIRMLFYLSRTIEEYIRKTSARKDINKLYNSKTVTIPKIKLYTIYTGEEKYKDHDIHLNELMKENDIKADIQMKVKVICQKEKTGILGQYIIFTKILKEQRKLHKSPKQAIKETIKICINEDILKEYLMLKKMEVEEMVTTLMSQEEMIDMYIDNTIHESMEKGREKGREEGRQEGREEGKLNLLQELRDNPQLLKEYGLIWYLQDCIAFKKNT